MQSRLGKLVLGKEHKIMCRPKARKTAQSVLPLTKPFASWEVGVPKTHPLFTQLFSAFLKKSKASSFIEAIKPSICLFKAGTMRMQPTPDHANQMHNQQLHASFPLSFSTPTTSAAYKSCTVYDELNSGKQRVTPYEPPS
jgi:hypothetical protein